MQLSIIVCGKNDDYCGDFLGRLKKHIASLHIALHGIDWEYILVDYNPPPNKPLLSSYFNNDERVRSVIVSQREHQSLLSRHLSMGARYLYSDREVEEEELRQFGFFGQYGFYVGLHYAQGEYILSTNSDDLFPVGLSDWIPDLKPNIIYRAWRRNVGESDVDAQMQHILAGQDFTSSSWMRSLDKKTKSLWKAQGNFVLIDRQSWFDIGGYLPIPHPRLTENDGQAVFFGLVLGKSLFCLPYHFINIHIPAPTYLGVTRKLNYCLPGIDYDHFKERECNEWKQFKKAVKAKNVFSDDFLKINISSYRKRFEYLKHSFQALA
jgi:hypothetical protein|tara:strand:- start:8686 stop:9651 length:966 start_codon:yes stop_codon:yes gene_type:complete